MVDKETFGFVFETVLHVLIMYSMLFILIVMGCEKNACPELVNAVLITLQNFFFTASEVPFSLLKQVVIMLIDMYRK